TRSPSRLGMTAMTRRSAMAVTVLDVSRTASCGNSSFFRRRSPIDRLLGAERASRSASRLDQLPEQVEFGHPRPRTVVRSFDKVGDLVRRRFAEALECLEHLSTP